MPGSIALRGVKVHNLKSIDLDIPHGKLIVLCGLSGSGKSSLALDTLYAEGSAATSRAFPPTRGSSSSGWKSRRPSGSTASPGHGGDRQRRPPAARPSARPPRWPTTCGCCSPRSATCSAAIAAKRSAATRPKASAGCWPRCRRARDTIAFALDLRRGAAWPRPMAVAALREEGFRRGRSSAGGW